MRYLKKIAVVSDISYQKQKMHLLPTEKEKIDDSFLERSSLPIYIIHGAIYVDYRNIPLVYDDNIEIIQIPFSDKIKNDQRSFDIFNMYIGQDVYIDNRNKRYYIDATNKNYINIEDFDLYETNYYEHKYRKIDTRLDKYIYSHGLFAWNREENWETHLKDIINNPEMEISCSRAHENLGDIGIYVIGHVIEASHMDINSDRAKNMKKVWDSRRVSPISKEDFNDMRYSPDSHAEIILTNVRIIGMWIRWQERNINELSNKILYGINEFKNEIKNKYKEIAEHVPEIKTFVNKNFNIQSYNDIIEITKEIQNNKTFTIMFNNTKIYLDLLYYLERLSKNLIFYKEVEKVNSLARNNNWYLVYLPEEDAVFT